ncbi:MAG: hemerythrin domain-containing protein [Candidatus Eremiobacteraeota bacterium]|nr:hemerythrin domain-containing protein [Candidatus Eremiobacteraeota bacterium]
MSSFVNRTLIQTCREHHAVLRALIERFPTEADFDAQAARELLARLTTVLGRHLELEDARLYPALEKLPDPEVAEKSRRYREEMGGLSAAFVRFGERWQAAERIESDPAGFVSEWLGVRLALERRMAAEDDDLYEEAERALLF